MADLLEWIGPTSRPYRDVQEAWRTSCPRLPVWEDACERRYLDTVIGPERVRHVRVTPTGRAFLAERGRGLSPPTTFADQPPPS